MTARICNHYVRFEDNIIRRHCDRYGNVAVTAAIAELKANGYDRSSASLMNRADKLRERGFLPERIDRRGNSTPVRCIETGIKYKSLSAAARAYGMIGTYGIVQSCKYNRYTSAGLHWQYL